MDNTYSAHIANQTSVTLEVLFYVPQKRLSTKGDLINTLTQWYDGPYCHTELKFHNEQTVRIMKHRHVELVHRSFDPNFYTGLKIKTTREKARAAFQLATDLSNKQVPFGITTVKGLEAKTTYCSKLVANVLERAGILQDTYETIILSPSALYRKLITDPHVQVSCFTPNLNTPCVSFLDFETEYQQLKC